MDTLTDIFMKVTVIPLLGIAGIGIVCLLGAGIGGVFNAIFGPSKPTEYLTEHDKLRGSESDEIRDSVLALGRKNAEAWCMKEIIAYDPELSQLELDSAYKNLKNMDLEALGVAIVEVSEL